jgi:hypothetical protein
MHGEGAEQPGRGKLEVETPSGRAVELFVSTQRAGGYVFWTKRRLFSRATGSRRSRC